MDKNIRSCCYNQQCNFSTGYNKCFGTSVYQFELTVTDNSGATGKDTMQVTVNPAPNKIPTANAGADITITLPTNSTILNGIGTDIDGTITNYQWTKYRSCYYNR